MDDPRTETIYSRIGKDLKKALRAIAVDFDINMPEVIERALREWIENQGVGSKGLDLSTQKGVEGTYQNSANETQQKVEYTDPFHQPWIAILSEILNSEKEVATWAIKGNLLAFYELATGKPLDPEEFLNTAFSAEQSLPPGEMERIHRELKIARQLNERAEALRKKHQGHPGKRRAPKKRAG